jgi:hypothetical protein
MMNRNDIGPVGSPSDGGFALPAALLMMVAVFGVMTVLGTISSEGLRRTAAQDGIVQTYLAAEGALNRMVADMSTYASLWDQQAALSSNPQGYTEYSPNSYGSTNGVPTCTGAAGCHRNFFPIGGGLIKNVGPLNESGSDVNTSLPIAEQIDQSDPPPADLMVADMPAWIQVERLDETLPSASAVGGNLSSSLAEGGNAKEVYFRLTGTARREVRGRVGSATVVSVVRMPVM